MRNTGRVLFWIGLPLLLIVIAIGIVIAVMSFRGVAGMAEEAVRVDGPTQVDVRAGESIMYYFPAAPESTQAPDAVGGAAGTASHSPEPASAGSGGAAAPDTGGPGSTCSVDGPDPQPLQTHMSSSFTFEGGLYRSAGGFTAGADGTYTVTCTGSAGGSSGTGTDTGSGTGTGTDGTSTGGTAGTDSHTETGDIVLAPPVDGQGIAFGIVGIVGAVLAGILFGAVTLVGLVLWIVGAKRMKRPPVPAYPAGPPAPGPPAPGPPGPGPQGPGYPQPPAARG